MKVKELIKLLEKLPQDSQVVLKTNLYDNIKSVYLDKNYCILDIKDKLTFK